MESEQPRVKSTDMTTPRDFFSGQIAVPRNERRGGSLNACGGYFRFQWIASVFSSRGVVPKRVFQVQWKMNDFSFNL